MYTCKQFSKRDFQIAPFKPLLEVCLGEGLTTVRHVDVLYREKPWSGKNCSLPAAYLRVFLNLLFRSRT